MLGVKDLSEIAVHKIHVKDLNKLTVDCQNTLVLHVPYQFQYPNILLSNSMYWTNHNDDILDMNKRLLDCLNHKENIYALHIKYNNSNWQIVYIGQRKSKNIRSRIIQHLIKKHKSTGSKLLEVKDVISNGREIGGFLY